MPVEILMPELGESVHEGTVSRWLKKVGDFVKEDEPIVEIMTDKVNTELPSPATGVLTKILIQEGDLVEVFHAMGVIEEQSEAGASPEPNGSTAPVKDVPVAAASAPAVAPTAEVKPSTPAGPAAEPGGRRWYTPVVRAMAKDKGISEAELGGIVGSGEAGRVTKKDLEDYLVTGRPAPAAPTVTAVPKAPLQEKPVSATVAGADQEVVKLSGLRKMIAEAMVRSSQVPTVSTVTKVDVTAMVQFREHNKESFVEQYGVKLT